MSLTLHPSGKFYAHPAGWVGGSASWRAIVVRPTGELAPVYRVNWSGMTSSRTSHWKVEDGDVIYVRDRYGLHRCLVEGGKMTSSTRVDEIRVIDSQKGAAAAFLEEAVKLSFEEGYHPSIYPTDQVPIVVKEKMDRISVFLRGIPNHVVDLNHIIRKATFTKSSLVPTSWKKAKELSNATNPSNAGESYVVWLKNTICMSVGYGCNLPPVDDIECAIKINDGNKFSWELYK